MSSAIESPPIESSKNSGWVLAKSVAVVFFLALIFHGSIEFRYQDLMGYDGYYHIKHAELYRTGECSIFGSDFPWAQFSGYNDLRHDWQLGYHLLLIPFTFFGLILGAKLSVVFFSACLVTIIYWILKIERSELAFPVALVFMISSSLEIWRLHLPRPTTLFLCVFLLTAYAASRKKYRWTIIGVVTCLLIYNVPHSLLALTGVATAFVSWKENRFVWRLLVAFGIGLCLGIVLHPGFWHWQGSFFGTGHGTFAMWEVINGTLEAARNGSQVTVDGALVAIETPSEFAAMDGRDILRYLSLPLSLLGIVFILLMIRTIKMSLMTQITLSLSLVFIALFLGSARFLEYWIPLFFVGGGLVVSVWFEKMQEGRTDVERMVASLRYCFLTLLLVQVAMIRVSTDLFLAYFVVGGVSLWIVVEMSKCIRRHGFDWRYFSTRGILMVMLALVSFIGLRDLRLALDHWPFEFHRGHEYKEASIWLGENSRKGELVFHPDWTDFAPIFFFNHSNHYVVNSDPYFFYKHDPELYAAWREVSRTEVTPQRLDEVLETMGASYAFARRTPQWQGLIANLKDLESCELVYSDRYAVVFRRDGE